MTTGVREPKPITAAATRNDRAGRAITLTFVVVPTLALLAALYLVWGIFVDLRVIVIAIVTYIIPCFGISAGFHRCFAHPSWKPVMWLRIALGIAGSMAIEGAVLTWCADHRRHHQYSDQPGAADSEQGDPHSPWRFGTDFRALVKGFCYAHMGWIVARRAPTNKEKFVPDLLAKKHMQVVDKLFPLWVFVSLALPTLVGYMWDGHSLKAAAMAFFWAGLVRIGFMHHVTWSINSICHLFGRHDFTTAHGKQPADHSGNVAWLTIFSAGESNHNGHHAFPNSYRHGLVRGQLDPTARVIWAFGKLKLATDLLRPSPEQLRAKQLANRRGGYRQIKPAFLVPLPRSV